MMYSRQMSGLDSVGRNPQADMIGDEMTRFAEFVRNFKGNPRQLMDQVLRSGQITQQDLNLFQQIRDSIAPVMGMMSRR